ncbi:MAG: hypothetical protein H5T62_15525, partial [Anaerolineae bacterium]|nr:hypothetical protein [Anaerolineae bacterium]
EMAKKVVIPALILTLLAASSTTGCTTPPTATSAFPSEPPAATPILVTAAPPAPTPTPPAPPTGVPTLVPAGTATPVTPASAYATQDAARQATIVARATASPFPTAGPATVQTGRPASATTQRGGLSFQMCLTKDTYLAGESGQAEITLSNSGPETVFIYGYGLHPFQPVLLDERGHEPEAWPWSPMLLLSPPYIRELAPGEVISETLSFQVPPMAQATGHTYVLWAETRFSRPAPDTPQGPDNLWLRLETGPIPLQLAPPAPSQQLVAELQADRGGWRLQVTDKAGRVPPGPLWGQLEATSPNSALAMPLRDNPDGTWSGVWDTYMRQGNAPIAVRAWVAAPGYVTAAVTQTVPGVGDAYSTFGVSERPHQSFSTLEEAQAVLDFPLYRPDRLPTGASLDVVQVETTDDVEHY